MSYLHRAVTRTLNRGERVYSIIHIFLFCRQISFQIDEFELDVKRNLFGKTQIYKYSLRPLPPNKHSNFGPVLLATVIELFSKTSVYGTMESG